MRKQQRCAAFEPENFRVAAAICDRLRRIYFPHGVQEQPRRTMPFVKTIYKLDEIHSGRRPVGS